MLLFKDRNIFIHSFTYQNLWSAYYTQDKSSLGFVNGVSHLCNISQYLPRALHTIQTNSFNKKMRCLFSKFIYSALLFIIINIRHSLSTQGVITKQKVCTALFIFNTEY